MYETLLCRNEDCGYSWAAEFVDGRFAVESCPCCGSDDWEVDYSVPEC